MLRRINTSQKTAISFVFLYSIHGMAIALGLTVMEPALGGDGSQGTNDRLQKHEQEFLREHTDESGNVRPDLWRQGIEHVKKMRIAPGIRPAAPVRQQRLTVQPGPGGVVGVQWTQIGPQPLRHDAFPSAGPVSGQVTDIAIDPRNTMDQIIYIAINDGGIWKSTDRGTSWKPKTDFMPSLSMGAVALDPSNPSIVYAGTGNLFNNGFFKGIGIYKSIDAGETWAVLNPGNIFDDVAINRIVVVPVPDAPNVLLVATTNSGLYRSVDGGRHFVKMFGGSFINELKLDTASPLTVYVSVRGQGIFRSTDGGATFPESLFNNPGAPVAGTYTNVLFDQSTQPNSQTLYATVENDAECSKGKPPALFKSTDGGSQWTKPGGIGLGFYQCDYDDRVGVDPQDARRVYVGLVAFFRSDNGGVQFQENGRNILYADKHALVFSPSSHIRAGAPTPIWVGTDGGIYSSANRGESWTSLNKTLATILFRQIDIGRGNATSNGYTYGGTQDNGTPEHRPSFTGTEWHSGVGDGGDGGRTRVDPVDPRRAYGEVNGAFIRTSDGGAHWQGAKLLPANTSLAAGPIAIDPNDSNRVYAAVATASDNLFRSTDGGLHFALIFPPFPFPGPAIESVANVAIDSNTLWVGLSDGTVLRTTNALSKAEAISFVRLKVTGAPQQPVEALAIDPANTDQVVVVYGGFTRAKPPAPTGHVFLTTNATSASPDWADISGTIPTENLPDLPLHSVVIDPGTSPHTIIVASDAAVMRTADAAVNRTTDLGTTWQVLGVGLPIVDSTSLALDPSVTPSLLRVGTYGRSVFELTAATGPLLAFNADLGFDTIGVGGRETRIVQLFDVGSTDLHISSFVRVAGTSPDFKIISGPATPVAIRPGEELDYTIQFSPSSAGDMIAKFQINSDDPFTPHKELSASGSGGT